MVREHSRTVHGPDRWYQVRRTSFVVELYVVRSLLFSFRGTSNTACRVATGGSDGGRTGFCVELLLLRWILDDDDDK